MADKAREWTDKKLAKMEREIGKIYSRAEKEMKAKWDAYMQRGEKRLSALQNAYTEALKVGDEQIIAEQKERLEKAQKAFTLQNDKYKAMVDSVTLDMADVNNKARAYVNEQLPEIYAKNYTQATEIIKGIDLDFTLPNENAIKNRILEGKVKTPFMRTDKFIKIPKDQRWNTKFINSEVLQGIIQGEDMRKIANRIFPEINAKNGGLPERNLASAIRNARTLVTGAENQGKHDSYEFLSDNGLVIKQVWIATGDDRTREAHLEMDGQEVEIGEPFIAINRDGSECELEYPADPNGDAEQVYNCRCALTAKVVGFRNEDGTIREIEEEDEGQDLHDRQIAEEVQRRKEEAEQKSNGKEPAQESVKDWRKDRAEFVPAQTMDEAEKFARDKFVSGGFSLTGKDVSFKGVDLDVANSINETLNDIYDKFNIDKLSSLEAYGKKNKKVWMQNAEAPFFTTNFGNMGINSTIVGTNAKIEKYVKNGNDAFDFVIANKNKLSGKQLNLAELYENAGRSLADDSLSGMITHEIGHHLSYMPEVNKLLKEIQKDSEWETFARRLSGYSNHSFGEYVAESFSAYYKGETNLVQPRMISIFERLRK